MNSFRKNLMPWKIFEGISASYPPAETYKAVPSEDRGGARRRTSSSAQEDNGVFPLSPGHPMADLSLPTDRFLIQTSPASERSSIITLTITMLINVLRFCRPSFLYGVNSKPAKILPTTYLNGVRGVAALCVYFQHSLVKYNKFLDNGYLSKPEENRILQMPFIRLMFTGRFMVANFFILSGFVLSMKPIKLIRKRDATLLDCLASSTFRRSPRLFLPLMPPMVISAVCIYFHWYSAAPDMDRIDPNYKYPTLLTRFTDEFHYFTGVVNPFTWGTAHPRNTPHFWTLPMEFRGSMIVFLSILCLSKSKAAIRMFTLMVFAWYCLQTAHWDTFLFVSGILLAELNLIQKDSPYVLEGFLPGPTAALISKTFWSVVFAFGLFIGSWPCEKAATTPGLIGHLDKMTPHHYGNTEELHGYFWYSLAAVMIMLAFENFPLLQKPFNTAPIRYLGDISFAFYIIHWTVLWTIGRVITNEAIAIFGNELGFVVGTAVVLPMTICLADVYWRLFDVGAVNVSRWLWDKCLDSEPQQNIGSVN